MEEEVIEVSDSLIRELDRLKIGEESYDRLINRLVEIFTCLMIIEHEKNNL